MYPLESYQGAKLPFHWARGSEIADRTEFDAKAYGDVSQFSTWVSGPERYVAVDDAWEKTSEESINHLFGKEMMPTVGTRSENHFGLKIPVRPSRTTA